MASMPKSNKKNKDKKKKKISIRKQITASLLVGYLVTPTVVRPLFQNPNDAKSLGAPADIGVWPDPKNCTVVVSSEGDYKIKELFVTMDELDVFPVEDETCDCSKYYKLKTEVITRLPPLPAGILNDAAILATTTESLKATRKKMREGEGKDILDKCIGELQQDKIDEDASRVARRENPQPAPRRSHMAKR
jgi:hypothetical protein